MPQRLVYHRAMADAAKKAVSPLSLTRWQNRLLPFMVGVIVVTAAFFGWVVIDETRRLQERIQAPAPAIAGIFEKHESQFKDQAERDPEYLRLKIAALLEQHLIIQRYAQGNTAMLTRVWTRSMGFITGVLLALIGAAFVLGKMSEERSELKQEAESFKISIATSSPGIILAVLGTVLMAITLLTRFEVDTRDVPVYLQAHAGRAAPSPPQRWPEVTDPFAKGAPAAQQPPSAPPAAGKVP